MTRSPDWSRALDAKADLARWWRRPVSQEWATDWLVMQHKGRYRSEADARESAATVISGMAPMVRAASPYFVTGEMVALIRAAAAVMPPEPFLETDPLERVGFVFLAEPIIIEGESLRDLHIRAFHWTELGPSEAGNAGTVVSIYCDKRRMLEHFELGEGVFFDDPGAKIGPEDIRLWRAMMGDLVPTRLVTFLAGVTLVGANADLAPVIKAFWTICAQRITHVVSAQPNRGTARRLEREAMPIEPIRVVTLRRRENVDQGEADHQIVDWSHRWIVSGHWRNQYLPSVRAHRLQWIDEYVKGPEDRPLVIKETVFRVAR